MRELAELKKNPPEGIRVQTNEQDMMDVTGIIQGPGEHIPPFKSAIPMADSFPPRAEGTPYASGYFRVRFKFTDEFPAAPPKC